jgi:hypothetical protein
MSTAKTRHTYPAGHEPGPTQSAGFNEAWQILDLLQPGAIDESVRSFLAGRIAASLDQARGGWLPPAQAPADAWPLAILVELTCSCGEGGRCVLSAARQAGEWVIEPIEHTFEIRGFVHLPDPDQTKPRAH